MYVSPGAIIDKRGGRGIENTSYIGIYTPILRVSLERSFPLAFGISCSTLVTTNIQWNLSIMDLQIKDTSVIRTPIDGPKRSAIETCTYLTSKLRTPLYSVLRTLDPVPNGHVA